MFKGLAKSLGKLLGGRVLMVLRRDRRSGGYVEDRDYAHYLKARKQRG